jgi:hypothetical protein
MGNKAIMQRTGGIVLSVRKLFRSRWSWVGLSSVVVTAVYFPLVVRESAWSDDYPFLEPLHSFEKMFQDGRPIWAMTLQAVFPERVEALSLLRCIGVLGTAFLIGYLTHLLIKWGTSNALSVLVAVSVGLLPPFHGYVGWASTFLLPWVSLAGGIAGFAWIDGVTERRWKSSFGAMLGMVVALLCYPPAAMFCWGLLGLRMVAQRVPMRRSLYEAGSLATLSVLAGLITVLTAGVVNLAKGIEAHERVGIVSSPGEAAEKLVWFITHPVVVAARPFQISSPGNLEALLSGGSVLIVIAIGLYLRAEGSPIIRIGWVALCGFVAALSMISHLVSHDNQLEYRYMLGLTFAVWGYLVFSLKSIALAMASTHRYHLTRRYLPLVGSTVLMIAVFFAGLAARENIKDTFVDPYREKTIYLKQALIDFDPINHKRVIVTNIPNIWPTRENIGIFSVVTDLSHNWVIEPNVRLVLFELGVDTEEIKILIGNTPVKLDDQDYELDILPYISS